MEFKKPTKKSYDYKNEEILAIVEFKSKKLEYNKVESLLYSEKRFAIRFLRELGYNKQKILSLINSKKVWYKDPIHYIFYQHRMNIRYYIEYSKFPTLKELSFFYMELMEIAHKSLHRYISIGFHWNIRARENTETPCFFHKDEDFEFLLNTISNSKLEKLEEIKKYYKVKK